MKQIKIKTLIGELYLVASATELYGLHWDKQNIPMVTAQCSEYKFLKKAELQLQDYFSGKRKSFNLKLVAKGTPFQEKVWQALLTIPYGETRSYQDIARQIKHPKAYRAVGTANGRNPIAILIPCHRVIAADGGIGGYGGGLKIKNTLLEIETA